jgi:steroid delta-isomerase-like uncharacterized protein
MPDTHEVARTFVDAFNSHDPARIAAVHSETVVAVVPPEMTLRGREAVAGYITAWIGAFPDAYIEVHDEHIAGDTAIQQYTFRGTHTGTLQSPGGEIPATGKALAGRGVEILTIAGDEVAELQLYFDQVQVMTQLGLMPEPASA